VRSIQPRSPSATVKRISRTRKVPNARQHYWRISAGITGRGEHLCTCTKPSEHLEHGADVADAKVDHARREFLSCLDHLYTVGNVAQLMLNLKYLCAVNVLRKSFKKPFK